MIRFSCPACDKALRADESKAGSIVKCPACGQKLTIPSPAAEPPPPEDDEPEPVGPRKKKRAGPRRKARNTAAEHGKKLVLVIIGVVVAMYLVSFVNYLLMPGPREMVKQQSRQISQDLGKDEQKLQQGLDKALGGQQMQQAFRLAKLIGLMWLVGSFSLSAILLLFLYLRHDWARVVLGILCLLAGGLGLLGLVFGGVAALTVLSGGAALLALLEMVVRLGVNFGIGATLMKSESIAAYTTGR